MLNHMRKHARSWVVKILLAIIIIVFIFYFGSLRERGKTETVAVVNDKAITYADFRKQYDDMLDAYRQNMGGNLPPEVLKGLNLKQQALDSLINEQIIMQKAAQFGIAVTDEEIKQFILSFPAFQRNGVFDERIYRQTLQMNKMSPEMFEAAQKRAITAAKLMYLLQDSVKVSDAEAYDLYRLQNEQMDVLYLQFSPADFRRNVNPSTADLEAFLKEQGAAFRVPEQVRVSYLVFSGDDYSAGVKVTDGDIRDYYERNKQRWKKGDKVLPLSEVKDKIAAELKRIGGLREASDAAKKAHDTIYQEENFAAYAAKNNLKVHTTDFFTAKNPPQEFKKIENFAEGVFTLKSNEVSSVLKNDEACYLFKLADRKAAYTPALKEIEPEVERGFRDREASGLAAQAAATALARLKKGEAIEKVAAEMGLKVSETGFFLPGSAVPKLGFSPALSAALFQISEKNPYPDKVLPVNGNFLILKFKDIKKADSSDFAAKKAATQFILREAGKGEIVKSWLMGVRNSMQKDGTLKQMKDAKDL